MTPISNEDCWRNWLSDKRTFEWLKEIARRVYGQARALNLPWESFSFQRNLSSKSPEYVQVLTDIAVDLQYYLWTEGLFRSPAMADLLDDEDFSKLASFVIRGYLQHIGKDEGRTMGTSPWRAYYRHVRQVLKEAEGFSYLARQQGAFYASADGVAEPAIDGFLQNEDFGRWNFPKIPASDLHKKASIILLADFFWEECCQRMGCRVLVSIRDFVRYISAHQDLNLRLAESTGNLPDPEEDGNEDADWDLYETADPGGLSPEQETAVSEATARLEDLVDSWKRPMCAVFALRYGEDLPLQTIATRLGFKSPANVNYYLCKAVDSLREFMSLHVDMAEMEDGDTYFDDQQGARTAFFSRLVQDLVTVCKRKAGCLNEE